MFKYIFFKEKSSKKSVSLIADNPVKKFKTNLFLCELLRMCLTGHLLIVETKTKKKSQNERGRRVKTKKKKERRVTKTK